MKLIYGGVPYNTTKVRHYETNTNDATLRSFDLQAGVTAYARGKKVTGTGKAFSFAMYGRWMTNESDIVPSEINIVHIGSTDYPIRMTATLDEIRFYDFSVPQEVAEVVIDGTTYPLLVSVQDGEFLVSCDRTINIQLFYGKDEYI